MFLVVQPSALPAGPPLLLILGQQQNGPKVLPKSTRRAGKKTVHRAQTARCHSGSSDRPNLMPRGLVTLGQQQNDRNSVPIRPRDNRAAAEKPTLLPSATWAAAKRPDLLPGDTWAAAERTKRELPGESGLPVCFGL
ncbi:unnamed protein product [Calypogeia fissa]